MMASVSRVALLRPVVVLAAIWAAVQGVIYAMNPATRHRVESAWFIFSVVLLFSAPARGRGLWFRKHDADFDQAVSLKPASVAFIACSFILYSPVLGIGLLSDDFVLLQNARLGALVDPTWQYVRPLPMMLWRLVAAIIPLASVPVALHALNVVLHGLNASLVSVCAKRFGLPPLVSWLAGLLFLCWPSNVEAVVWASGVFDVVMTGLILACLLVMLSDRPGVSTRTVLIAALTAAAVASKETAVVLPLLLLLVLPFLKVEHQRAGMHAVGSAAMVVLLYAGWRLGSGVATGHVIPASGYAAKEILSRAFGTLAAPFHANVLETIPLIGLLVAIGWPFALAATAWRWQRTPDLFKVTAFSALWVLTSILPLSTMFFIGNDLQGSRYLYLATAAWSIALMVMVVGPSSRVQTTALAIAVLVIVSSVAVTLAHQRPWIRAAQIRDTVLEAWQRLPADCTVTSATGLPDDHQGAYIFRNGFTEAARSVRPMPASTAATCAARWNDGEFIVDVEP